MSEGQRGRLLAPSPNGTLSSRYYLAFPNRKAKPLWSPFRRKPESETKNPINAEHISGQQRLTQIKSLIIPTTVQTTMSQKTPRRRQPPAGTQEPNASDALPRNRTRRVGTLPNLPRQQSADPHSLRSAPTSTSVPTSPKRWAQQPTPYKAILIRRRRLRPYRPRCHTQKAATLPTPITTKRQSPSGSWP